MARAQSFAGTEFTIAGKQLFVGLFAWPDASMPETYFADIMVSDGADNWTSLLQLPPITKDQQTTTPLATAVSIFGQFNAKITELVGAPVSDQQSWNLELKKFFDSIVIENNLIKLPE